MGRRARVFHFLGDLQNRLGNWEDGARFFRRAYDATEGLYERDPRDDERLFNHSQSAFWVGYSLWQAREMVEARATFEDYLTLVGRYKEKVGPTKVR